MDGSRGKYELRIRFFKIWNIKFVFIVAVGGQFLLKHMNSWRGSCVICYSETWNSRVCCYLQILSRRPLADYPLERWQQISCQLSQHFLTRWEKILIKYIGTASVFCFYESMGCCVEWLLNFSFKIPQKFILSWSLFFYKLISYHVPHVKCCFLYAF